VWILLKSCIKKHFIESGFMREKERWDELVETLATETDPEKVRLACAEIDRLSEQQEPQALGKKNQIQAS